MSKGLEVLEELKKKHFIDGRLPLIDKIRFELIEKELKEYEETNIKYKLAIEFIDSVADEFDEHDLDELVDKIVKAKKSLEVVKKAFNSSSVYTNKLEDSLECGWITQDEYDLLKEVVL